MIATTKNQIEYITKNIVSASMKEPLKELLLRLCYLAALHGKSDDFGLYIETSANRLKSSISKSKATTARYINILIKSGYICRSAGRFKEASKIYICSACLNPKSENETLVKHFKNNINKSIKGIDLITHEYKFYKDYHSDRMFHILGRSIPDSEVRYLMSLLTEQDLNEYREKLPEKVTRQYVINGLFMLAFNKNKTEKTEEAYTLEEVKEEYAYDTVASEIASEDKNTLDMMMQILKDTRNEIGQYIRIGKENIRKDEYLKTTENICVETIKLIINRFNYQVSKIRNPKAYLRTLIFNVTQEEDFAAAVFGRRIVYGYLELEEEKRIERNLDFILN